MVSIADAIKVFSGMESNPRAIREIGAELARGMQQGGNARSYSSMNPTGQDSSAGVAGGRGTSDRDRIRSEANYLRSEQLRTEVNRKVFNSYKKLNKKLDESASTYDTLQDNLSSFAKVFAKEWEDVMERVEGSSRVQQRLIDNLNTLGYEDIKTTEDLLELREKQQKLEEKLLTAKGTERLLLQKEYDDYKKLSKAMAKATKGIDSWKDKLSDYASNTGKAFFTLESATAQLTLSFGRLMNDIQASMKFGASTNIAGVFNDQVEALKKGMDPAAYAEMTAGARQAAFQFANMSEFAGELGKRQREYYGYIGDTTEAAQFATNSFMLLGRAGIDPTSKAFDSLGDSFRYLNKAAGVTADQFNVMMEGLVADENIQTRLRSAQAKDRAAILSGIAARLKNNVAIGMSTEKALEAARAMGRIAGGDARERIKQAAMARMQLGAMGMGAEGARAYDLIVKGQRMNDDERAELQRIMGQASQFMAETKQGPLGQELTFGAIMNKSGMEQFMGPNSPFNTSLEKSLALDREDNAAILQQLQEGPGVLSDMKYWVDIVKNGIMESPIISAIGGVAAAIGAAYGGSKLLGALGGGGRGGIAGRALGGLARGGTYLAAGAAAGYAGYEVGSWLNELPEKWGFDSLSTNLVDGLERLFGEPYDPNADVVAVKTATSTEQMVEPAMRAAANSDRQLSESEKQTELLAIIAERQAGMISTATAEKRIADLQMGMQPSFN